MPSTRHGSVLKGAGKEAEKGIKKKKSKAEPAGNASPMRKKAVAQLLRAEKETEHKGEIVPVTPLSADSSPAATGTRAGKRILGSSPAQHSPRSAFAGNKKGKLPARTSPFKRSRMTTYSPQKAPDTPNRPGGKRALPPARRAEAVPAPSLKTVSTSSFYKTFETKSFQDFDGLELAPAFLVEQDGKLLRGETLKKLQEQEEAIEQLNTMIEKKTKKLTLLEERNKDGKLQQQEDKLREEVQDLLCRLEFEMMEKQGLGADTYSYAGAKPVEIAPAKSVPGTGEFRTKRSHCLVPRAFFKRSNRDRESLQAKHAERVLAQAYSGSSWLVE